MRTKILTTLAIILVVVFFSSCASQKYGCPNNPQYSYKFKG